MRTEDALHAALAIAVALLLAACASGPPVASASTPANATPAATCVQPPGPQARADYCRYPADVRAYLDDRDVCDHFRGEPWPEGDSEADLARRRELLEGMRTSCAGMDQRLAGLRARYRDDAAVMQVLAEFEDRIAP